MEAKQCERCRRSPARVNRTTCEACARKLSVRNAARYRALNPTPRPRGRQVDQARIEREDAAALQWLVERGHRTS
jgi:hypothetical protein